LQSSGDILSIRHFSQALCGKLAPFGAACVYFRVAHRFFASRAVVQGFIFPEFYGGAAVGAQYIVNIFRFPIPLILAGTARFRHFSFHKFL
jgi:hypothetical protein